MGETDGARGSWDVDDYLDRVEQGRAACLAAQAAEEAEQCARLHALMPATAVLRTMLEDLARRSRVVRRQRHQEVTARLRQPSAECVRVSLRWGDKFELTDAERHLIHSYRSRRVRRILRYPEVVVAHEFEEVAGVLDGGDHSLQLDPGPRVSIHDLLVRPGTVLSAVEAALARPRTHRLHLRRADGYEATPR